MFCLCTPSGMKCLWSCFRPQSNEAENSRLRGLDGNSALFLVLHNGLTKRSRSIECNDRRNGGGRWGYSFQFCISLRTRFVCTRYHSPVPKWSRPLSPDDLGHYLCSPVSAHNLNRGKLPSNFLHPSENICKGKFLARESEVQRSKRTLQSVNVETSEIL